MRKLTKLTFIFVAIICIALSGKAYAASLDCNIEIQTSKTEYAKGGEFTANVCVSEIKSEKGVLALSAVLDYDKDSLNLIEMTGKNSWDTPAKDVSYNESTGKMVLLRDSLGRNNEVIFEMKFQVNKNSDATALIALNEVTIVNGDDSKEVGTVEKNLAIINATTPPPSSDDNPGNNPPSSGNTGDNNQGGGNSSSGDNNNQGSGNSGNNDSSNNNGGSTNNGGSGTNNGGSGNGNSGSSNSGSGSNNSNKKPSTSGSSLAESLGTVTTTGTPTDTDSTSSTNNNTTTTGEINIVDKASGRIPKTGIGEVSYTPIYVGLIIILIIAMIYCFINMKLVDRDNVRI